jgi:hypothetical protein
MKGLGMSPLTFVVQVSTSKLLVSEVMVMVSISSRVGGERKLLIWNLMIWFETIAVEKSDAAVTLKAVKLPVQNGVVWALASPVQLIDDVIGSYTLDMSFLHDLYDGNTTLILEEEFNGFSNVT